MRELLVKNSTAQARPEDMAAERPGLFRLGAEGASSGYKEELEVPPGTSYFVPTSPCSASAHPATGIRHLDTYPVRMDMH